MKREELIDAVINRLQICGLACQLIIDNPTQADANQRRAANIQKQLGIVTKELASSETPNDHLGAQRE